MCVRGHLCEWQDTRVGGGVGVCVGLYVGGIQWAVEGVVLCGW